MATSLKTRHQGRKGKQFQRVSKDRTGKLKSNEEQGTENEACCERHGITLTGEPYTEEGSASKFRKKKTRGDDFLLLMEDLESGRFTADGSDVLVMWENSRGSRKTGEWCSLIDVCEEWKVDILVATHDRMYVTSNARDRRSLQEDAVDSEYESAKTSMRVSRDAKVAAQEGRPHGRLPYGYVREYNMSTKKMISQHVHPEQGPLFKKAVKKLLAGKITLYEASVMLGLSTSGTKSMFLSPTYIGVRLYDGVEYVGQWEPLMTRDEQEGLRAIFAVTEKGPRKHRKIIWPYSPVTRCGLCGSKLVNREAPRKNRRVYSCPKRGCHGVSIDAEEFDDYIEAGLQARIDRKGVVDDEVDPEIAVLINRESELTDHIANLDAQGSQPGANITKLLKWSEDAEAELAEVKAKLVKLQGPKPDLDKWVGKVVKAMSRAEQTRLAKDLIETFTVMPVGHRKGVKVEDRVTPKWR